MVKNISALEYVAEIDVMDKAQQILIFPSNLPCSPVNQWREKVLRKAQKWEKFFLRFAQFSTLLRRFTWTNVHAADKGGISNGAQLPQGREKINEPEIVND